MTNTTMRVNVLKAKLEEECVGRIFVVELGSAPAKIAVLQRWEVGEDNFVREIYKKYAVNWAAEDWQDFEKLCLEKLQEK